MGHEVGTPLSEGRVTTGDGDGSVEEGTEGDSLLYSIRLTRKTREPENGKNVVRQ